MTIDFSSPNVYKTRSRLQDCGLILGGGAGTRLFPLTGRRAKPAVPIGGCYRLIDVPMSNCINNGINKIYILTQFSSQSLNRHIARTYNLGNGVNFGDGFVEVKLSANGDEAWKDREAAVLALGAIAEGCISVLYPHLSECQGLRCPNCRLLLPEAADVPVYKCGGCSTDLQDNGKPSAFAYCSFKFMRLIWFAWTHSVSHGLSPFGVQNSWDHNSALYQSNHFGPVFLGVVGFEFVQKYLGEGLRMVCDVFRLAKLNAHAIIFIDKFNAITTARFDAQTGADREVQQILMERLNQMDGFDQTVNVKVNMATNWADTLDPALLRPRRLDRKIEFPLPDRRQKRLVFQVCTAKVNFSDEVDLEDYVSRPEKISAAEEILFCYLMANVFSLLHILLFGNLPQCDIIELF
ncbi:hypothetical protein EZV62_026131 [Acer yangbiense]|uniref:Nucleotidyl transferase domain-containing protein n=1 Tax=Acer yangbiense TaxID=1000413 RepID=A0A5C7GQV8_9ROSI|nr:hypothetical protein EZV62_026131 [Acer yangbiense]